MNRSIFALALVAAGCSEFNLNGGNKPDIGPAPDILVDPPSLAYGTLSVGDQEVQTFTVQNIGDATLHVSDIVIGSGIAFIVQGPETQFDLEPGQTMDVDVAFSPMGADENYGQVLVVSDDPDTPEAPVDLLGFGAVPELKITPDTYVFGDAPIPCGDEVELELKNVGSEALTITEVDYTSGGLLSLDTSNAPQLPITLQPGEFRNVTVMFEATTEGSDTGRLAVTSNDPRGVVTADQNGEGVYGEKLTETFTEPGVPPVDVIILIDQSCSMSGDNTDDVENGMPDFVAELQQTSDWHLIEVTRQTGCANGGVLTETTPNVANTLVNNAFNSVGNIPDNVTESLLELADTALSKTGPGQCNEGFLRPGALLHVITMSDEPEQSGHNASYWVNQLGTYASSPDFLKISGILDLNNRCGEGAGVYSQAVDQTGGSKLNICNSNWGANFGDIASEVLAGIRTYNLSNEADPNSVVVTVNGTPTTDFTVTGGNVTINNPPVGEGDEVTITYGVLAECN
ncbi:MAG: choice-of-anchor D domain-containing protein [Alphaproteobacteria bacterium]|nr:choice-of-anchor D domain-containing protein [Alphaproteobacteria bacterium]MCB9697512.1 choice-of-anchor D domain-containing protein [Alphaproteobacteria bacterium]